MPFVNMYNPLPQEYPASHKYILVDSICQDLRISRSAFISTPLPRFVLSFLSSRGRKKKKRKKETYITPCAIVIRLMAAEGAFLPPFSFFLFSYYYYPIYSPLFLFLFLFLFFLLLFFLFFLSFFKSIYFFIFKMWRIIRAHQQQNREEPHSGTT